MQCYSIHYEQTSLWQRLFSTKFKKKLNSLNSAFPALYFTVKSRTTRLQHNSRNTSLSLATSVATYCDGVPTVRQLNSNKWTQQTNNMSARRAGNVHNTCTLHAYIMANWLGLSAFSIWLCAAPANAQFWTASWKYYFQQYYEWDGRSGSKNDIFLLLW